MTEQTLARIFRPFEQGSDEIVRRYGGLGLGLTISKALLEAHGGEIEAFSEGLGRGSTFTVTLPTVETPRDSQRPASGSRSGGRAMENQSLDILLVEDHEDTARVLSRLLGRLGHRVRVAGSVSSGLASAREPLDLLLSDIGLPDGTGMDLIRRIRQERGRDVPAIALTGFGMEEDIAQSRAAGFAAHLTKPINFQRLQLVIQKIAGEGGASSAAESGTAR
jgi:hypothetical protein